MTMKNVILSLLLIVIMEGCKSNESSNNIPCCDGKKHEVKQLTLDSIKFMQSDIKNQKFSAVQLQYVDIQVPNMTVEVNQTVAVPYSLPGSLGDPIGGWIGVILSGSSFPELSYTMTHPTRNGGTFYLHNTTDATPGYNGPGHGERVINNFKIRLYILYSL